MTTSEKLLAYGPAFLEKGIGYVQLCYTGSGDNGGYESGALYANKPGIALEKAPGGIAFLPGLPEMSPWATDLPSDVELADIGETLIYESGYTGYLGYEINDGGDVSIWIDFVAGKVYMCGQYNVISETPGPTLSW